MLAKLSHATQGVPKLSHSEHCFMATPCQRPMRLSCLPVSLRPLSFSLNSACSLSSMDRLLWAQGKRTNSSAESPEGANEAREFNIEELCRTDGVETLR